ncbi:MAG: FimV/HubP family polar landmark protein [Oceanococcus sp.]
MVFNLLRGRRLNRLFPAGAFATLLGLSLLSSQAAALSVGRIQVSSFLNEPFRATVPLSSVEPGEAEQLRVRLADDSAYATLGLEKSRFLTTLQFSAREGSAPGSAVVAISSRQVAKEPFFSVLLEFRGLGGRIIREYTVLLDPNTGQRQQVSEQAVAPAPATVMKPAPSSSMVVASSRPVAPVTEDGFVEMQELPANTSYQAATKLPTVAPSRKEPVQAFENGSKERQVQVPSPQVFVGTKPVIGAAPVAAVSRAGAPQPVTASNNNEYGPVPAGMTLWQIAAAVRPSASLTMNQVMWGLFSVNEAQFDGNLNLVRRGATLTVPSAQAMRNVSPGEAAALVADQADQFRQRGSQSQTVQATSRPNAPEQLAVEAAPRLQSAPRAAEPQQVAKDEMESSPREESVIAAIQEPKDRPVEVIEEQALEALPSDDGFEELEELPLDEASLADASDSYADLPALPDDASGEGFDDFDVAEENSGFDAGNDAATENGESGGLLGWLLAGLGVIAAGLLAMFALRKRGQPQDSGAVSDYGSTGATSQAAGVSDFASDASDVKTKEFPTVTVDDVPETVTTDETDFEIPDLDTLAAVDDGDVADFGDTAIFDATQDELTPAEVDFGDTEIGQAVPVAEAESEIDAGPMTLDMPDDVSAEDDLGGGTQTLDLGSETVSLELNEDPVSEADFQLAYGLYDEAALLLNRAIENDPDRLELHEKLAETYFASSDADNFKLAAQSLQSKAPDAETWQRISIMGQQLCPGDELFSGDLGDDLGGAVDLDMDFDGGAEATPAEDSNSLDFDMPMGEGDAPDTAGSESPSVLEFELEETPVSEATQGAADELELDDFDADFASLDASDDSDDELPELDDLDLGDLEAELDSDDEHAEVADFESETMIMEAAPELEPAVDAVEEPSGDDFADLTLSDISDTELGLDVDSGDAGDVLGVGTDFDLADELTSDSNEESIELSLSEEPLELDTASDELSIDDLSLDKDDAEDAQATDFDLGDLSDDPAATDFDLDDLSSDDLSTGADELSLGDLASDSKDDFDLGELTDGESTGLETDFDLGDLESDESSSDLELGAVTDFDLDNPVGEPPSLDAAEETDFDLGDLGDETDLDLSANADAGDISGGDEAGTKLDLARAYVDMGEADMARGLLDEVAQSGSGAQKAEAQELLGKL